MTPSLVCGLRSGCALFLGLAAAKLFLKKQLILYAILSCTNILEIISLGIQPKTHFVTSYNNTLSSIERQILKPQKHACLLLEDLKTHNCASSTIIHICKSNRLSLDHQGKQKATLVHYARYV